MRESLARAVSTATLGYESLRPRQHLRQDSAREIPCNKIYEDEHALCFHDVAPQAPVHALIIPKGSYRSFSDFATKASNVEREEFFQAVHKCAQLLQLEEGGYRLLANHGADARQEVSHFLVHVCGGGKLGKLVTIP